MFTCILVIASQRVLNLKLACVSPFVHVLASQGALNLKLACVCLCIDVC